MTTIGRSSAKRALVAIVLVAYPLVTHLAVLAEQRWVGAGFALVLGLVALWALRRRLAYVGWGMLLLVTLGGLTLGLHKTQYVLYALPVLISASLLLLFARTLLPDHTPLITALATVARSQLPPHVARYTRRVTQAWTLFFAYMSIELVLLAAFAPLDVWSLFANGLNYLFAGLLFLGEYGLRRYRLADLEHPGFLQFLRFLSRTDLGNIVGR